MKSKQTKIKKAVERASLKLRKIGIKSSVLKKITRELNEDLILPMLVKLVPIDVFMIDEDGDINVYIGARDWQFDKTGKLLGAGTCLGHWGN
jgi:hypothetical protein